MIFIKIFLSIILFVVVVGLNNPLFSQVNNIKADEAQAIEDVLSKEQQRSLRLKELATVISDEKRSLITLERQLNLNPDDEELKELIQQKNQNLKIVQKSFEQITIGGINLDVFNQNDVPKDWQEELTLIIKPLLENLRGLTEKPRQREELRQMIVLQKSAAQTASLALSSIEEVSSNKEISKEVRQQVKVVENKWQQLLTEAESKQELARIELSNLNGTNTHWFETVKTSLLSFARERGLTLLIAAVVAILIVFLFRLLAKLIEHRRSNRKNKSSRTTYRVIAYAQRLLTMMFVVIGVMVVFFIRGDVLLMAVMSILLFVTALGLRNFLPQFLVESRILLNIGRVREHELVVYNGVPWRIATINVFSKLINPEIKGVLRLPLDEIKLLTSRKIGNEKWFPSSIGDWVLDDSGKSYEVMDQGPDAVELQSAQGTNKLVPTADYYAAGFVNLTKSEGIRIVSVFGVDYSLQSICLDEVPQKMQQSVQKYLEDAGIGTTDIRARVEFKTAGSSSLDYLVIVNVGSSAAANYYRIQRYIQQACVKVCNEEGWTIPFPQLSISKSS